MKLIIHEHMDGNGEWTVLGEVGDGDAAQYFHATSFDHDDAVNRVITQAKSFKTYEVEI